MRRVRGLNNGVRVALETMPGVRSCALGVWVAVGSRHETMEQSGISHFIEHMLFKGTPTRGVEDIANEMNYLGGQINAFTTQEYICLHARTIDYKAAQALDLIGELLTQPLFPEAEVGRERRVVLEECKMYEDTPDELIVDLLVKNLWPNDALGRPVIGRKATIRGFRAPELHEFWHGRLCGERVIVAVAGAFDARAVNRVIRKRFGDLPRTVKGKGRTRKAPVMTLPARPRSSYLRRQVEQAHFCMGTRAPHRTSEDRYAFSLLNLVLGGGMNSRLFSEIREKRGLAYSIGSFVQPFTDCGYFAIHGGTSLETLDEVVGLCGGQVRAVCEQGVTQSELDLARAQLVDSILMSLENTEARAFHMGESLLHRGEIIAHDVTVRRLERVGVDDLLAVAGKYLAGQTMAMSLVGPKEGRVPRVAHTLDARRIAVARKGGRRG